ncbi:hypothetical protein ANO11243_001930 [Dothideomycetidae sp. 11243]|nr:hypothetical protein ANO11243_001930 [fungal sp. No.11243]
MDGHVLAQKELALQAEVAVVTRRVGSASDFLANADTRHLLADCDDDTYSFMTCDEAFRSCSLRRQGGRRLSGQQSTRSYRRAFIVAGMPEEAPLVWWPFVDGAVLSWPRAIPLWDSEIMVMAIHAADPVSFTERKSGGVGAGLGGGTMGQS